MAASKLIIFVLLLVATVSVESLDWVSNCKTHSGIYCDGCASCTCEDYAPAPTPAIDASESDDVLPVTCVTQSGKYCSCEKYFCACDDSADYAPAAYAGENATG